jgi:hypothetical protein
MINDDAGSGLHTTAVSSTAAHAPPMHRIHDASLISFQFALENV